MSMPAWIIIHIRPTINKPGLSKIANIFIFIPMVATKMYMKTLPILEAPTPSNSLAFVNERITAKVVEITINQKNLEVRLN